MVQPTKHPKTHVFRIRQAIPPHLCDIIRRDHGVRSEPIRSLGTKDPAEAKRLAPPTFAQFGTWLSAAQAKYDGQAGITLTDREISALCGRWLERQEAANRDNLQDDLASHEAAAEELNDIVAALAGAEGYDDDPRRSALRPIPP
jgi:hypothetical protein